jgi:uncharacterized repeat protein (TIGR01451 family)
MPLKLVLALLLVVAVVPEECGMTPADFGNMVVSYDITVTNVGPGDAIVGISATDVKRRAVVPAGTSVTATSYASGSLLISASPAADVLAQMKARRDQIAAKLDAKPIDSATSIEIYNQLGQVNAEIHAYESEQHRSLCTYELEPDGFGHGHGVAASASFDGSRFNLAC